MIILIASVALLVGIMTGFFLSHCIESKDERNRDKRELAYYRNLISHKSGWNIELGSYNLVSFDGGNSWYNYKTVNRAAVHQFGGFVNQDGMADLTPADNKLVERLWAWDRFNDLMSGKATVDPTDPKSKAILENVGITVVKKNSIED